MRVRHESVYHDAHAGGGSCSVSSSNGSASTCARTVESAIRRGTGLHRNEWEIAGPDGASDALAVIAEEMVD